MRLSKHRLVNTRFWDDNYIVKLKPREKLLFLYFLTNPQTNICGIYEIDIRRIAFDTAIRRDRVAKMLEKFEEDSKIKYENGWIAIRNFIRYQADNPKIRAGICYELATKPEAMVDFVEILDYEPTQKNKRTKISKTLREKILKRDNNKCCLCGEANYLEIDHIKPIHQGGTNEENNLRTLCHSCNGKRNAGLRWDKVENGWRMDTSPIKMGGLSHTNLNPNINFKYKEGKFDGLTPEYFEELKKTYPGVDVDHELCKMGDWLMDNPKKKRQGKRSFIGNWLKRANGNVIESEDEGNKIHSMPYYPGEEAKKRL